MSKETKIGGYRLSLERPCWVCNICKHPTYKDKVKHKCHSAPHFLGISKIIVVENLTKEELKKTNKFLKKLRDNNRK